MSNYTKEFKLEAIRLLESKEIAGTDLARELGVKREMLYRWQEEYHAKGSDAFPGRGRPPKNKDDVAALKRELAEVKEEPIIMDMHFIRLFKYNISLISRLKIKIF